MKISFGLRAFGAYFIVLALVVWYIFDEARGDMKIALQQSAESVLVDTANLLATMLEQQLVDQTLAIGEIERLFSDADMREMNAQIYEVRKQRIDIEVYITDRDGIVVYHSLNEYTGKDFSTWRDVSLTLDGEYGARTSFRYSSGEGPSIMVVAAPIRFQGDIIGVVSAIQPLQVQNAFLSNQSRRLWETAATALLLGMLLVFLISQSFTRATEKLANYADEMASGEKVESPEFSDKRFDKLAESISSLRHQLDGKQYIEEYTHSLTHELKTPITAVRAAAELLQEDLPDIQRHKFIANIQNANHRMSILVDRVLELANLEGRTPLQEFSEFDLTTYIDELIDGHSSLISSRNIQVFCTLDRPVFVQGDQLLIQQAIANLLDNALQYGPTGSKVSIQYGVFERTCYVEILNLDQTLDSTLKDRAFDRFFSVPSTDRESKSTGLGLSFVREIMRLHRGTANLSETPGGIQASIHWPERKVG